MKIVENEQGWPARKGYFLFFPFTSTLDPAIFAFFFFPFAIIYTPYFLRQYLCISGVFFGVFCLF